MVDPLVYWKTVTKRKDAEKREYVVTGYRGRNWMFSAFLSCAWMLFSILAGSSLSEREFSSAGRVYSELRNSMSDETLEDS
jgi:hypothetical protein